MVAEAPTSAVARAAAVLMALSRERSGRSELSVSEVASAIGRERSQVSRMLKTLASVGFVEQDPETRSYRLGWQLHLLVGSASDERLVSLGRHVLRALVAETGESTLLSVLQQNTSFTILKERSQHSLQAGGWAGRTSPLHVTASGRALLFDSDPTMVKNLVANHLGTRGYGPGAPRNMDEVLRRLAEERRRGYTAAVEELEVGLVAVGAPIRNGDGRIVASLNVSGPTTRLMGDLPRVGALTQAAAQRLSLALARRSK